MKRLSVLLPLAGVVGITGALVFIGPRWLIVKDTEAPQVATPKAATETETSSQNAKYAEQVKSLVKESRFAEAIAIINKIRPQHPSDVLAVTQLKGQVALEIYNRAVEQYRQGNVKNAIEIADKIPLNTGAYNRYSKVRKNWIRNETLIEITSNLLSQQLCTAARETLENIDPALSETKKIQALEHEIQELEAFMMSQQMQES